METESEPYVRLATLRQLHQVVADLNTARSLADTLQTVADGVVTGLGYELACVNLVRPDGDLIVAAFAGNPRREALHHRPGRLAHLLGAPAVDGRALGRRCASSRTPRAGCSIDDDVPQWHTDGPAPRFADEWHPDDRLYAPMYASRRRRRAARRHLRGPARATAAAPAPGAARRCRCTPSRPPSRSATPGCAPTCSAPWSAWSASSRRCGPARSPSGRRSSTRPAAWPSPRWAATSTAGCCAPTTRCAGCWAARLRACAATPSPTSSTPRTSAPLLRTSAEGGRAELRLGPARRHLPVGLAAQLRRRRHRRRPALPAHPRRGHRGAQAPRAAARAPRQPRRAHRPAQQRRAALPARRPALRPPARGGRRARPRRWTRPTAEASDEFGRTRTLRLRRWTWPRRSSAAVRPPRPHRRAATSRADDGAKGLAVLFCDLDGFKSINDRFGHHTGDAVLIEVARRLTSGVRDGDTVARLGGDEFVVLADGLGARGRRRTWRSGCATRSSRRSGSTAGRSGSAPASASAGPAAG